jgi:hypothetical protein
MTPAELLAWAARMEQMERANVEGMALVGHWDEGVLAEWRERIADLRLASRLARFAAERGGLEETDGKA